VPRTTIDVGKDLYEVVLRGDGRVGAGGSFPAHCGPLDGIRPPVLHLACPEGSRIRLFG
jgi:hypothetical protein